MDKAIIIAIAVAIPSLVGLTMYFIYGQVFLKRIDQVSKIRIQWIEDNDPKWDLYGFNEMLDYYRGLNIFKTPKDEHWE